MKKQKKRTIDSKIYEKDTSVFLKSSKNLVHTNVLAKKCPRHWQTANAGGKERRRRNKKIIGVLGWKPSDGIW